MAQQRRVEREVQTRRSRAGRCASSWSVVSLATLFRYAEDTRSAHLQRADNCRWLFHIYRYYEIYFTKHDLML